MLGIENRLFTIGPYNAFMVQPWCVSRFYGQLGMLEASIERASALLSKAYSSSAACSSTGHREASAIEARYEQLFDPSYISRMRVLLRTIAAVGFAALWLMLIYRVSI